MPRSTPLAVYRGATFLLEFGAKSFLRWRMRSGKEDPIRLPERLAQSSRSRPAGALAWVHGASVGEGLALLPLIEQLAGRGFQVLLSTGTVTSSRVLAARLPPGAFHQFAPLDGPRAARRFLRQWRPDLVCFAESDLWPNLLIEAKRRGIPTALVNARMSARSFARWQRLPSLIRPLLGSFDLILAQTDIDASRLTSLGATAVTCSGNLKFDVVPPSADPAALLLLQNATADRPVWIAASTHAGEDETCCAVHGRLKPNSPRLLTIIVPRKIDRGPLLKAHAAGLGLSAALRSAGEPIRPETDIYIADTVGELGLFFRLETVVFVGKSLVDQGGGQNPIEPSKLGNAVLHGPHTANFADVYTVLDRLGGGIVVDDEASLATAVRDLLADTVRRANVADQAGRAVDALRGATARTMTALEPILVAALGHR